METLKFGNGTWATKEGSTLAYNNENNNFKPLPFTTTRASSATMVNKQGLVEVVGQNTPRIDYTNSSNGVFLLEKAATNTLPYSSDFSQYTKINCTVLSNQGISPDGTLNADLMTATANDASLEDIVGSAGVAVTQSIYVKSANGGNVSGQIDFAGANIVGFIANNEWQRIESTLTNLAVTPRLRVRITNSGGELLVWGAQLETGSYATSYIPTQGSAVTVVKDVCTGAGNDQVINSEEGVLYAVIAALADDSTNRMLSIYGSANDRLTLFYKTASNSMTVQGFVGGGLQINRTIVLTDITQFSKIAIRYKTNDFAWYVDGIKITDDTSTNTWSADTLNKLSFNDGSGGNPLFAKVKQLQVYKTALTDTQLAALTS